jgi:broad specificity phosphatase PhoE
VTGKPDIWLVRHGATEWSELRRHTGRTDIPLTVEGRRKAAALSRVLDRQRFELVLTSPLRRARETARLAGFADAVVDPDLVEWDYGDYEGLTSDQICERDPGWTIFTSTVPGGETAEAVGARAGQVLDRVSRGAGPVLLFAHGHFLRVLTATALELGPRAGARFVLDPATIGVIGSEHSTRALSRWNEDVNPI